MVRILVADDHAILRAGLKEILVRDLKDVVCGNAESAQEVLDAVAREQWDLVILDVTMPGRSGLDILGDLKRLKPGLPVLMLSMHPESDYGKRALRAGASGYLPKESAPKELLSAIRKVLGGGRYVSEKLAEALATDLSTTTRAAAHQALSSREFEILRMLGSGKSVTQIAEALNLGATTVSTYRARILEKMDLTTTAELIRYAVHHGLAD